MNNYLVTMLQLVVTINNLLKIISVLGALL